jgi:hypothetical protein
MPWLTCGHWQASPLLGPGEAIMAGISTDMIYMKIENKE